MSNGQTLVWTFAKDEVAAVDKVAEGAMVDISMAAAAPPAESAEGTKP